MMLWLLPGNWLAAKFQREAVRGDANLKHPSCEGGMPTQTANGANRGQTVLLCRVTAVGLAAPQGDHQEGFMASPRKRTSKTLTCEKLDPSLSIIYRDMEELKVDPKNPRLHSERQIRQIARSIEAFGFNVPFLIDRTQKLIAGHGRLFACRQLGIRRVPCISLEHLTESQVRAFMIADNRLAENATWDERLLAEQFKALSEVELDFSSDVTGFEIPEIDLMIEGLAPAPAGARDPADELPEESAVRVTQAGDLWLLGRNRLICGSALDERTYSLLIDSRRAAAVFTDPPYNDPIDGYVTNFGRIHHAEFAMASGEMSTSQFTEFLRKAFSQLARSSQGGALHFICIDWRHIKELLAAAERVYRELKNLCVWVKDSGGQGSLYRSQHELVFVFKSGKDKHRNNIQLGQYGRYRTNIWQYPRVNSLSRQTEEGNLTALHPTVKPVAMVADAILDSTARGDIVLDAFLGSGTTLIAAERTGRICYGIELEPTYVDVAIRRWQTFTSQTATQSKSGRSFRELEEVALGIGR